MKRLDSAVGQCSAAVAYQQQLGAEHEGTTAWDVAALGLCWIFVAAVPGPCSYFDSARLPGRAVLQDADSKVLWESVFLGFVLSFRYQSTQNTPKAHKAIQYDITIKIILSYHSPIPFFCFLFFFVCRTIEQQQAVEFFFVLA